MDPTTLAATVTAWLAPVVGEAEGKGGAARPAQARRAWAVILDWFNGKPAAQEAAKDFADEPDDEDNQAAFRKELKKALAQDPALAAELQRLAGGAGEGPSQVFSLGSGAVARDGGVAAGAGGVAIGGSVHGDIVTGPRISGDLVEGDKVLGDKIARQINTGGGAYVARDVNTLGGDFVGRDKVSFSLRQAESADDARPRLSTEGQKLAALLEEYFDNEDLQVVCQQLRLDWDNLGKAGKRAGLASLVGQCERTGQTAQLKAIVRLARPQLKRQLL